MRQQARRLTGVTAAVATLCATAALAIACDLVGDDDGTPVGEATATPSAVQTPAIPPEEALRLWVERRLTQGFLADCADARRPDDVGKQCGRFLAERDGLLAYELGPTFSEATRLIILKRVADTWTIEHLENRNPDRPVPGIPWPLEVGANVVVAGTGDCLRVRERPGTQGPELACLDDGTAVTISSGPVEIDDFEWWQLEGYGWSAANWLRYPEEAPTPGPTATPEG